MNIKEMDTLLAEWDWEKNTQDGISPDRISHGSTRKVWWKCSKGHGWQTSPNNRGKGQGCPVCAGRKVLAGDNDLRTRFPAIAAEWSSKNFGIRPEEVTSGSNKRVWWRCSVCGHEWQTSVANRTAGKGCPVCARKRQGERRVAGIVQTRGSFGEMHPELLCRRLRSRRIRQPVPGGDANAVDMNGRPEFPAELCGKPAARPARTK